MIDDDELMVAAKQLVNELPASAESIRDTVLKVVAGLVLPLGIGSALTSIVTDAADRRWRERGAELINLFAERIGRLTDAIDSQEHYASEEFQALFIEALDQQRTNRYRLKREMLAQGLAQSGTRGFVLERDKETFFRVLRDLSPEDVQILERLACPTNAVHMGLVLKEQTPEHVIHAKSVDSRVYRLQGLGLVTTFQRLPAPNLSGVNQIETQGALNSFVAKALGAEPHVVINVSDFGRRFLQFLLEEKEP
jgi:hypothetical protein